MVKRASKSNDGLTAFRKRQKVIHEVPAGEDVYSGDELRRLLSFDQDLHRARHGKCFAYCTFQLLNWLI